VTADGDIEAHPGPAPSAQAVLALDTWTQPPRRPPGPAAPVLATAGFEGPLDWLLDLARSRRIDLARLSIAELIAAFETALTTALDTGDNSPLLLARWGDWLVMATELTLLRSRLLLPTDAADAEAAQDAAERLRQTLLSRAETAQAADWLEARGQVGRDVFLRGTDDSGTLGRKRTGNITALLRACLVALRLPAEAGTLYRVPGPPVWSVLDALARLRDRLPALKAVGAPLESFLPTIAQDAPDRDWQCRTAVSATFLAGLELARDGVAALAQDEGWQPIQIGQSIAATSG
jgi:segregation and condensation protein A